MTKKKCRRLCIAVMLALGIVLLLPVRTVQAYEKKTIYNSPYVSFSPDGKAWKKAFSTNGCKIILGSRQSLQLCDT